MSISIREYLSQRDITLTELAKRLNISTPYLSQIMNNIRPPSLYVALALEKETEGKIKASDLRPEITGNDILGINVGLLKRTVRAKSLSLPPEAP
ncbi:MAG: helix-turn-helix transcriptional regulator [Nitrospirae bacterium]|nr:helix-turn-helix transcriptional regulator [Nitrospirota bacterium]